MHGGTDFALNPSRHAQGLVALESHPGIGGQLTGYSINYGVPPPTQEQQKKKRKLNQVGDRDSDRKWAETRN